MDTLGFLKGIDEDVRTIARAELDSAINHINAVIAVVEDDDNVLSMDKTIINLTLLKALFISPDDIEGQKDMMMAIMKVMSESTNKRNKE